MRSALLVLALVSIAFAVTVKNGEESLFLASPDGSPPIFSYYASGADLTIRADPFETGASLGLFCSRNSDKPTPTSYQWGVSGERPILVLPSRTAGFSPGTVTCIVTSTLTIQAGFNATEGALTGSLIAGAYSYGYVSLFDLSYYEFRVTSFAKIVGITIEANAPTTQYNIYASVRSARPDQLADWVSSGRAMAITGASLTSALASRKLKDRLFVAVKLSVNSAYTIPLRLYYTTATTGIYNGVTYPQSLTTGTVSEQAFYSLVISASMKTYSMSLTCTPTKSATTKMPFMYASFNSINPSALSNQWRSEYPGDRQVITIPKSDMAKAPSTPLYISLISQSTQPAAVSLLVLSPAEQPIALVDSAPYRTTFTANIYKYFTLEITPDMIKQTLTINSTNTYTSFYASMSNQRPDSAYYTWAAPSKPLVIIPADSQYTVGTMYLGIVCSSTTDLTILASTPSQGGSSSTLRNGTVTTGVVVQGGYNYYSIATQTSYVTDIQVLPDRGVAYLYASYQTSTPNIGDFEWASTFNGANGLLLGPGVTGYRNGTLYLSVYGKTACNYKLTAQQYKRQTDEERRIV